MASQINNITSGGTTLIEGDCPRTNTTPTLLDNTTTAITTSYLTNLSTQSTLPLSTPTASNLTFATAGRIASNLVIATGSDYVTFTGANINIGSSATIPQFIWGTRIYPSNLYSRWNIGINYCKVVGGLFTLASGTTITVPTASAFSVNDAVSPVLMFATPTTSGVTMGVNPLSVSTGNVVYTGASTTFNCAFIGA